MNVDLLITAIVAGFGIGSVYGLVALGYTVIYNATGVFNMAQGELVLISVFSTYFLLMVLDWPQWLTFITVMVFVTLVGLIEEELVVRPFLQRSAQTIGWFLSTLGFGLVALTVVVLSYGNAPARAIRSFLPRDAIRFGRVSIAPPFLLAFLSLIAITVLLQVFYRRTLTGIAMRGVSEDRGLAAMRGIKPPSMSRLAFVLGGATSAFAGFILAPITSADVSISIRYSLIGFLALAIGGFGSLFGALIGAWLLGVSEQLFALYVDTRLGIVADLGLLVLILLLKPNGILGSQGVRRV